MDITSKNVLIVDDEKILRDLFSGFIELFGANKIFTAEDGEMAKEIIEKERVGLIISDNNMPGITGLDLLMWVRNNSDMEISQTPFILATGIPDEGVKEAAEEAGVNAFLAKPLRLARFKETIKAI